MKIINKDITTVEDGIIIHQVNCQGVMGSGVALALRDKWPIVFDNYIEFIEDYKNNSGYDDSKLFHTGLLLGYVSEVRVIPNKLTVINLFGQNRYGVQTRQTSYAAWEKALYYLNSLSLRGQVYFPYLVGCDRAGGDFRIISAMIEEYFPNAIFCKI